MNPPQEEEDRGAGAHPPVTVGAFLHEGELQTESAALVRGTLGRAAARVQLVAQHGVGRGEGDDAVEEERDAVGQQKDELADHVSRRSNNLSENCKNRVIVNLLDHALVQLLEVVGAPQCRYEVIFCRVHQDVEVDHHRVILLLRIVVVLRDGGGQLVHHESLAVDDVFHDSPNQSAKMINEMYVKRIVNNRSKKQPTYSLGLSFLNEWQDP